MHELVTRLDAKPELRLVPYTFQRAYGGSPEGVWSAPYAVRLAEHDLAVPVQWQVIVAASARTDGKVRLASLNRPAEWLEADLDGDPEVPGWARSTFEALRGASAGADVLVHTDLPPVAGLSVDVPLACAAAMAGRELHGTRLSPYRIAELIDFPGEESLVEAILIGRPVVDLWSRGLRLMLVVGSPEIAVEAALAGGAVDAWPHGVAAVVTVPASSRPAMRAAVAAAFGERGLRPPRFLNLTIAGAARRQA